MIMFGSTRQSFFVLYYFVLFFSSFTSEFPVLIGDVTEF